MFGMMRYTKRTGLIAHMAAITNRAVSLKGLIILLLVFIAIAEALKIDPRPL